MLQEKILSLLKKEVLPATGCTGPTAYALAAASCKDYMTSPAKKVTLYLSPVFLKIGFGVASPGTTRRGLEVAVAAGLICGDSSLGLNVLKNCTAEDMRAAEAMADSGLITIACDWEQEDVYVRAEIVTDNEEVAAVVSGRHDKVVSVKVDGREVFDPDHQIDQTDERPDFLTIEAIMNFVETADTEKLAFLMEGFEINLRLAEEGLKNPYGLISGRHYLESLFAGNAPADLFERPMDYLPDSLLEKSRILVAAASDARMGGSHYPAMTIMGDGNQGITALLPIGLAGRAVGASDEKIIRALALCSLVTIYIKSNIGRASAFCLCAIAASAGAASGICYLQNLGEETMRRAVKNVISSLAGMLCDGAKDGCAFKMSVAATSALFAVDIAKAGSEVGFYDGVADTTLEQTVKSITSIATETQALLDELMVKQLLEKSTRSGMCIG